MEERIAALEARIAELEAELAKQKEDVLENRSRIEANIERLDKHKKGIISTRETLAQILEEMTEKAAAANAETVNTYEEIAHVNEPNKL